MRSRKWTSSDWRLSSHESYMASGLLDCVRRSHLCHSARALAKTFHRQCPAKQGIHPISFCSKRDLRYLPTNKYPPLRASYLSCRAPSDDLPPLPCPLLARIAGQPVIDLASHKRVRRHHLTSGRNQMSRLRSKQEEKSLQA